MTAYDDIVMSTGAPHPLAGVPLEVLDAAHNMFREIARTEALPLDSEEIESIAHSVLMAGVVAYRKTHRITEAQNE